MRCRHDARRPSLRDSPPNNNAPGQAIALAQCPWVAYAYWDAREGGSMHQENARYSDSPQNGCCDKADATVDAAIAHGASDSPPRPLLACHRNGRLAPLHVGGV